MASIIAAYSFESASVASTSLFSIGTLPLSAAQLRDLFPAQFPLLCHTVCPLDDFRAKLGKVSCRHTIEDHAANALDVVVQGAWRNVVAISVRLAWHRLCSLCSHRNTAFRIDLANPSLSTITEVRRGDERLMSSRASLTAAMMAAAMTRVDANLG